MTNAKKVLAICKNKRSYDQQGQGKQNSERGNGHPQNALVALRFGRLAKNVMKAPITNLPVLPAPLPVRYSKWPRLHEMAIPSYSKPSWESTFKSPAGSNRTCGRRTCNLGCFDLGHGQNRTNHSAAFFFFSDPKNMSYEPIAVNKYELDLNRLISPVYRYELVFVLYKTFPKTLNQPEPRTNIKSDFLERYAIGLHENDADSYIGGYDLEYGPNDPVRKRIRQEAMYQLFQHVQSRARLWFNCQEEPCLMFDCERTMYSDVELQIGEGFMRSLVDVEIVDLPSSVKRYIFSLCGDETEFSTLTIYANYSSLFQINEDYLKASLHFFNTLAWQSVYERLSDHIIYGNKYFNICPERRIAVAGAQAGLFKVDGIRSEIELFGSTNAEGRLEKKLVLSMMPTQAIFFTESESLEISVLKIYGGVATSQIEHALKLPESVEWYSQILSGAMVSFKDNIVFAIHHLDPRPPSKITFEIDGASTTVKEYFMKKHNYDASAELPCVARKIGNTWAYYPMDVLKLLPNQVVKVDQLPTDLLDELSQGGSNLPHLALDRFKEALADMHLLGKDNRYMEKYGMSLRTGRLVRVHCSSALSPRIIYGAGVTIDVQEKNPAAWPVDIKRGSITSVKVDQICFINTCCDELHIVHQFVEKLEKKLRMKPGIGSGISIVDARDVFNKMASVVDMLAVAERIIENGRFEYVYFLALEGSEGNYIREVFKLAEFTNAATRNSYRQVLTQQIGYKTMCTVASTNREKRSPQILESIAMKTNLKLGGVNYNLLGLPKEISDGDGELPTTYLVIGIDMLRPGRLDANGNVLSHPHVGSMTYLFNYRRCLEMRGSFWFQTSRDDGCRLLGERFTDALAHFVGRTGEVPERILVYWNVPDINKRLNDESQCLRSALSKFIDQKGDAVKEGAGKLTLIAVDQNPTTRFLFIESQDDDRAKNVQAGTYINEGSGTTEFTMVSHDSPKGLANPVKYRLIDGDASIPRLQDFTHALCYLQNNSWKSISVPCPLYGATKLTKRALSHYRILEERHYGTNRVGKLPTQEFHARVAKISSLIPGKSAAIFWA
uniref:Piwi domain-containing protein n=1 Tax=Steinernema glaseri TaxID=37863 RepID=A0A1I7YCY1_9BILA